MIQLDCCGYSFSLREKARMRGYIKQCVTYLDPLTPALSLRERGLTRQ